MSRFLQALHSGRVLLIDGAMGTELQRAGIQEAECYELWNLSHPDQIRTVHQAYVDAGAQCLLTNTFQANPAALSRHGLRDDLERINQAALDNVRSVCGMNNFVLADIGPSDSFRNDGDAFDRVIRSLRTADALLLETWSDSFALHAAERASQPDVNPHGVPVLLSFTYRLSSIPGMPPSIQGGGLEPERLAELARAVPIAALGVNCGRDIGMDEIIDIIRRYRRATDLPLFARPNAGTPSRAGDRWVYPVTPGKMAGRLPELLEARVAMVGGCCGTTPEHIAALRTIIDAWNARRASPAT